MASPNGRSGSIGKPFIEMKANRQRRQRDTADKIKSRITIRLTCLHTAILARYLIGLFPPHRLATVRLAIVG